MQYVTCGMFSRLWLFKWMWSRLPHSRCVSSRSIFILYPTYLWKCTTRHLLWCCISHLLWLMVVSQLMSGLWIQTSPRRDPPMPMLAVTPRRPLHWFDLICGFCFTRWLLSIEAKSTSSTVPFTFFSERFNHLLSSKRFLIFRPRSSGPWDICACAHTRSHAWSTRVTILHNDNWTHPDSSRNYSVLLDSVRLDPNFKNAYHFSLLLHRPTTV